jgi:hypothetical protein
MFGKYKPQYKLIEPRSLSQIRMVELYLFRDSSVIWYFYHTKLSRIQTKDFNKFLFSSKISIDMAIFRIFVV